MPANAKPPARLARFIDAQGHRVTAEVTRSGLLAILTRTVEEGIKSGHPCLNAENAVELRDALNELIGRGKT